MILFYLFSFALGITLEKSSWSFNPNCPTEDAARNCEDVCITANAKCIPDCEGDQECIRQCSRDYALCVEACPCYSECYGGCPCPNDNEYCQSCESRYKKEHDVCRDIENKQLDFCFERCSFNETCADECYYVYKDNVKVRSFYRIISQYFVIINLTVDLN